MMYAKCSRVLMCLLIAAACVFGWPAAVVAGPDYVVTGDGGPVSPNGDYFETGVYSGKPYYEPIDEAFALWWDGWDWIISAAPNDRTFGWWESLTGPIEATYGAAGTYTGEPVVIPEPGTLSLLVIGGLAMMLRRRGR